MTPTAKPSPRLTGTRAFISSSTRQTDPHQRPHNPNDDDNADDDSHDRELDDYHYSYNDRTALMNAMASPPGRSPGTSPGPYHSTTATRSKSAFDFHHQKARSSTEHAPPTAAESAQVLWLIDTNILPLMLVIYFLQALDKSTLSYASIFGIIEDSHLEGNQYSWLSSIVYVAQLLLQLPIAWALVKYPTAKFLSVMVLAWGFTLMSMIWAKNFHALLVTRFFLGAFETVVGPGFVAITAMWWRRREQTMRTSIWYAMNGMTWIIGSLITYGLGKMPIPGFKPYQTIFLIFGGITMLFALVTYYRMPDSPLNARFFNDRQKIVAIERLRDSQMASVSTEWRFSQFWETLRDKKTWLWALMFFAISAPSGGVATFGPLIIKTVMADPFHAILFNIPTGIVSISAICGSAWLATKIKLKGPVIALFCIFPIMACMVFLHYPHNSQNETVLLVGYLAMWPFTAITPLLYSWSAQNTAGETKKKTTQAVCFITSSIGNVVGPLLYTPEESPEYTRGLSWNLVLYVFIVGMVFYTSAHLKRLNASHARRRVALGKRAVVIDTSLMDQEEAERILADKKNDDSELGDAAGTAAGAHGRLDDDSTDLQNEDFVFVL